MFERLKIEAKNSVVVVEGKNDKKALETQGVEADFYLLQENKHKSLELSAEWIAQKYSKAILMFDYDQKGKELTKKMKTNLQKVGVKTNTQLATRILIISKISVVEGLGKLQLL